MTIGNVTTVRWLNTAVTLARIYLSVHGLNEDDTATLELIILFIVTYYFPMYFYIKVGSHMIVSFVSLSVLFPIITSHCFNHNLLIN